MINDVLPFEDSSQSLKEVFSESYGCRVKKFDHCKNNNLIMEGTFNRLLSQMQNKDFAIISAYRHEFSKEENILRNRKLRGILDMKRMGVHPLVGHWPEVPSGVNYRDAKPGDLTDVIERSYFIARPDDMDYNTFRDTIIKCLTIDGANQDNGIIHMHGGWYYCIYPNGSVEKIGENLTLNKIAQAYSQYVKRMDIPFVFDGTESPSSISGRRMFQNNGLQYSVMQTYKTFLCARGDE